jgi:hydroxymethylglutaryl-CoA reductase
MSDSGQFTRPSSRISGYFKRPLQERVKMLVDQGRITESEALLLTSAGAGFPLAVANTMIENVIGVYGLPIGLGLNFLVNGRDYVVPMVVEEPSIVAAVSHSAKLVREAGGFTADSDDSVMIGQVQVLGCDDPQRAREILLENRSRLLAEANALHPNLQRRGGGAIDVEVRVLTEPGTPGNSRSLKYRTMVVLHLLVDTCDAMGANLVNTMAEGVAPTVEELTGGVVHLRILSNLADRRCVRASCRIPLELLERKGFDGARVAHGIEDASRFAEMDPYRAATHNKGVMNGIDAVAIATGNDWRAIEAGAHAYCCRDGQYAPMATWKVEDGALVGKLEVPLQVGIVGGPIRLHPTLQVLYKLVGVESAFELGELMGAVGLAQNLAALRALATEGIQEGHMALHARTVAATAGAVGGEVEEVARLLIAGGDIKVERARELLEGHRVS